MIKKNKLTYIQKKDQYCQESLNFLIFFLILITLGIVMSTFVNDSQSIKDFLLIFINGE